MAEPTFQMATCRTDGCGNADAPVSVPNNGAPTMCGVCEVLISDFTPPPVDEGSHE